MTTFPQLESPVNEKPSLEDLGLDAPAPPASAKKTWQQIADQADDSPFVARSIRPTKSWNGVAAVMSFIVPGLGQLYRGKIVAAIVFLLFTVIGYGVFIVPGIVMHIIAIVDAGNDTK